MHLQRTLGRRRRWGDVDNLPKHTRVNLGKLGGFTRNWEPPPNQSEEMMEKSMADDGHVGIARPLIHISYTIIDKFVPFLHDKRPCFLSKPQF